MINFNLLEYINRFSIEIQPISEILRYFGYQPELSYKLSPRILINLRDQYYLEQLGLDYVPLIF